MKTKTHTKLRGKRLLPEAPCSTLTRLQNALIEWRAAERKHAEHVLRASHPIDIREAADIEERAISKIRIIIDSEPWSDIAQGI